MLEPHRWKLIVRGAWKFQDNMHLEESRVAVLSLRHTARSKSFHGCRALTIGDNLSEILASEKGLAADPALRSLLQRALAFTLGPEIRWYRRYVESARNPSDADSRWVTMSRQNLAGCSSAQRQILPPNFLPGPWLEGVGVAFTCWDTAECPRAARKIWPAEVVSGSPC